MSRIELAPEINDDLERIFNHLAEHEVSEIPTRINQIMQAISVLELNPRIGRPVRGDLRELVIGKHSRGYVALYRYIAEIDTVFVLALRGQREAGYAGE